ncbi:homing endonuclease associated repeat-containing protein [Natrialbaceae archaeon A-CW2]
MVNQRYTEKECLSALLQASKELGHTPTTDEYSTLNISPSASVIADRCGTWSLAISKAGLEPASKRDYNREDCLRAIRYAARDVGHEPSIREYKQTGYSPSTSTIAEICGSWNKAKEMAGVCSSADKEERSLQEKAEEQLDLLANAEPVKPDDDSSE